MVELHHVSLCCPQSTCCSRVHCLTFGARFDIIGDLSFGEPFDCLRDSHYHPWIKIIFQSIKVVPFLVVFWEWGLLRIAGYFVPKKALQAFADQRAMSKEKVHRRIELGPAGDRKDFLSFILEAKEEKGNQCCVPRAPISLARMSVGALTDGELSHDRERSKQTRRSLSSPAARPRRRY